MSMLLFETTVWYFLTRIIRQQILCFNSYLFQVIQCAMVKLKFNTCVLDLLIWQTVNVYNLPGFLIIKMNEQQLLFT